jgi:phage baseplate assembly protein W
MIKQNLQYSDLPFFISKNAFTGDLNMIKDLSAIRQSIKNLLMTNRGERGFDFNLGGSLYATLFENYNIDLVLELQSRIANNIRMYERRVELNDVKILDNTRENAITVVVDFSIPNLNMNDVIRIDIARTR